jgi:hypothetical protein
MRNVLVITSSEWPVAALRAALGQDVGELRLELILGKAAQNPLRWSPRNEVARR